MTNLPNNNDKEIIINTEIEPQSNKNGKKKKRNRFAKMRLWKKIVLLFGVFLMIFLIIALSVYSVLYLSGKSNLLNHNINAVNPELENTQVIVDDSGKTVTYNGEKYRFNEAVTSVLCLGIDNERLEYSDKIGTSGQADAVYLCVLDTNTGKTRIVTISRDAMVDVNVYAPTGEFVETDKMQLCLAYAYGDGKEGSCKNVVRSVERLLYGVPVNSYFAIDLSAISILNDRIGGVEVSEYTPDYSQKTGRKTTLYGKAAREYVQKRDTSFLDSNNYRMERQLEYIKSFSSKVIAKTKSNLNVPLDMFNTISKYSVTNVNASAITYLTTVLLKKNFDISYATVKGEVVMGEEYAEFVVDEKALYELVLDLFYEKVA